MGFLSSLFSFGDSPATKTTTYRPTIPEELKPYVEQILKDQKILYEQRMDEGFTPYEGETIAPLTPEEIASQEGLKSLVGTQAPLQQEALNLARGATEEFTGDTAKRYMSPYLRASLDAQKDEAQRQYERTKVPEFEAQAVRAGGMSGLGTRAAVEAAERATGQQRLLGDIEAKGQQKAFEAAQEQFENQQARERQAAAQISTAAPQIFKSGVAEQGLLQTIGEDKRQLGQASLDEAYARFIEQQQFPETQLARYQSAIYGNPILKQKSGTVTGVNQAASPGLGKTLLGLGTAAMGFGTGGVGGGLFGSMFGNKAGGGRVTEGLTATMQARPYVNYMRRNMGGQVVPPVVYRQENGMVGREEKLRRLEEMEGMKRKSLLRRSGLRDRTKETFKETPPSSITNPFGLPKKQAKAPPRPGKYGLRPQTSEEVIIEEGQLPTGSELKTGTGLQSALKAKQEKLSKQIDRPRPILAEDRAQTKRELENIPYDAERRESIELYGSESGDDTGGGIGKRNIALQNLAIDRLPISTDTTTKKEGKLTAGDIAKAERKNVEGRFKALGDQAKKTGELNQAFINKIEKRNQSLFDKIEKRIGKDPYKRQKFFTGIAAAMMQPGNVFANGIKGLAKEIEDLDATRKEKDELLTELDKTRVETANELDKNKLASDMKVLGLTTKQKNLLAGKDKAVADAIIKYMKAGATFKTAEAAVIKARAAEKAAGIPDSPETSDFKNLDTMFVNAFSSVKPVFGIDGSPMGKKDLQFKSKVMTDAGDILNGTKEYRGQTGAAAANAFMQYQASLLAGKK